MHPAPDAREWLALDDDDRTTWLFDVAFMLSDYHCIYGQGCPSIEAEPDPTETMGCCSHGAHFVDKADRDRVVRLAGVLTDDEWQYRRRALDRGGPVKKKSGEWMTRKAEGACIFLNRADFSGGKGCALHIGATNRGERPLDWKPSVCWQLPIRLDVHTDEYGYETVLVRAWQRRDWGPGGSDFHWWCTEEAAAYTAPEPVYLNAREELVELVGEELYRQLVGELSKRAAETPVSLS